MAAVVITNMYVALAGTDRSTYVKSATLSLESDAVSSETMGDTWKEFLAGLKSGQLDIEWADSVTTGEIDSVLWALFATSATFEVRLDGAAVGVSNPKFTGSVLVKDHSIGGAIGEQAMKKSSWPTTGTVTRATA